MLAYLDTLIGFAVVMLILSLLITILTQIISALVNHRGSNLLWGLKTLFANIDPKRFPHLASQADAIARDVLTHCLISDSWFSGNKVAQSLAKISPLGAIFQRFQLASAIRPGELTGVLQHLAENKLAGQPVGAELYQLVGAAEALGAAAGGTSSTPANAIAEAAARSQAAVQKLESWFGSVMDRVSERFAMYMRIWTVVFACVFAFGTGLNTIKLINEIYTNGSVRAALVGAGQATLNAAGSVLEAKNSLAAKYGAALQQALDAAHVTGVSAPTDIATPAAIAAWIAGNVPDAQRAAVQSAFDTASLAASRDFVQSSVDSATRVTAIANNTGFYILLDRWPKGFDWRHPATWSWRYMLGVLFTAMLLSLGAPFWFNALKSMTNLRSTVAAKQDAESSAAA